MSELSKVAKLARNESTAALLRGGTIRVYGGAAASSIEEPVGERPELVRLEIPDSRLSVRPESGAVIARGMKKVRVEREGEPTFWRACSREGAAVAGGKCVCGEAGRSLVKSQTPSHDMVLEVDKLWRGMEFEMAELKIKVEMADV